MLPLNAIDAIAPAFTRTHDLLLRPFRLGRSWKLCISHYLGFCGTMFLPVPLVLLFVPASVFEANPHARSLIFTILCAYTAIYLVILYFCARMELVCFEMTVTRQKMIAPMWRRYSARIWPWFGYKILIGTVFFLIVATVCYGPIKHMILDFAAFVGTQSALPHDGNPDPAAVQLMMTSFVTQMFGLYAIIFSLLFLLKIPSTLLHDFVMPFYLLEDLTVPAAIARGWRVFAADPLGCILYLILKPILFIIAYIMQMVVMQIAMIPIMLVGGIFFGIGALIYALTGHHSGPMNAGSGLLLGVAIFLGVLILIGFIMWLTTFIIGYFFTLFESYSIYFLAGRYPHLATLLEPGPGGPFTPPPVFPSPEERSNDDGGPPFPMDPAVA